MAKPRRPTNVFDIKSPNLAYVISSKKDIKNEVQSILGQGGNIRAPSKPFQNPKGTFKQLLCKLTFTRGRPFSSATQLVFGLHVVPCRGVDHATYSTWALEKPQK